ncbi:hypothetical protein [Caballeronia sp. HLA56]
MSALAFLSLTIGTLLLYLCAKNQTWLQKPLPAIPTRIGGAASMLAALVLWTNSMQPIAGVFLFVTAAIVMFVVYPYLGALRSILKQPRS